MTNTNMKQPSPHDLKGDYTPLTKEETLNKGK